MRGATNGNWFTGIRTRDFNPRSPCGERHGIIDGTKSLTQFQSTLPMRGATAFSVGSLGKMYISIHAPHAGSDKKQNGNTPSASRFQSTLPMRGATFMHGSSDMKDTHFNPRSPCGERQGLWECFHLSRYFNPRSPCGERHFCSSIIRSISEFQSTLPMRGATLTFWSATVP